MFGPTWDTIDPNLADNMNAMIADQYVYHIISDELTIIVDKITEPPLVSLILNKKLKVLYPEQFNKSLNKAAGLKN